jgi:drug/metabolite transporter (DMT)-like permease
MKAKLVWLVLCAIWGSTWIFIKVGLEDLPPLSFAGIRFVVAVVLLAGVVLARRIRLPRSRADWTLIAVVGVLSFTLNYGLLFWGEQYISSGLAALLQTTIPAFGLVIAHVHLPGERLTPAKVAGVGLGIFGVAVVFSNQLYSGGRMALWGSVAIVVGAFSTAYGNVLVKARGGHLDPAILAAGQMAFGLAPLLAVGAWLEGNPLEFRWTPLAVVCLLYLAVVGSALAFQLFYWLVRNMDVTKTMLIALVTPLVAVALGMAVRGEQLTWQTVAGGVCIMAGIGLITVRRLREHHGGESVPSHVASDRQSSPAVDAAADPADPAEAGDSAEPSEACAAGDSAEPSEACAAGESM